MKTVSYCTENEAFYKVIEGIVIRVSLGSDQRSESISVYKTSEWPYPTKLSERCTKADFENAYDEVMNRIREGKKGVWIPKSEELAKAKKIKE